MTGGWRRASLGLLVLHLLAICTANASKKLLGSKDCIVSQYCQEENASKELQEKFDMTAEDAADYLANNTLVTSCSCLDSCSYFGICCQDKNEDIHLHHNSIADRLKKDPNSYICKKTLGRHTVVVNSCPQSSAVVLRNKCAQVEENEVLVTSNVSSITYKNFYCGLCNGEKFEDLLAWSWNFDCYIRNLPPGLNVQKGVDIISQAHNYGCSLNQTIPLVPPNMMEVHHLIGVYLDNASLCTAPPVSSCPSKGDNSHSCANGPVSLIEYEGRIYRNEHCLRCSQGTAALSTAICEACENEGCKHIPLNQERPLLGSFGILVQPYDDVDIVSCKTKNDEDCGEILDGLPKCGHGQYLDYHTSTCQNVCPRGFTLNEGECQFIQGTCKTFLKTKNFEKTSRNNSTLQLHDRTYMLLDLPDSPCYKCNKSIPVTVGMDNYQIDENGQLFYKSNKIPANFVYRVDERTYYACLDSVIDIGGNSRNHMAENVITYLLLSLSLLSLLLYFVAYAMFKRLRNVPGKIVLGNMVCLFLAYVFFLVRNVPGLVESNGCTAIAILINYFFLSSFVFNIIYAAFIVHSLGSMEFESSVTLFTAVKMWLIGLFMPFLVIVPGIVLDQTGSSEYRPQYGGKQCFIDSQNGKLIYFIAPIGLCLLLAVLLYLIIIIKLINLAKETSMVRSNHSEKIAIAFKLVIVLGFNWIFAVVAAIDQGEITTLIFIITCTLQGFFGFVVFICNKTTVDDIRKCVNKQTTPTFEMTSSTPASNGHNTVSTQASKQILQQRDSASMLLKTDDAA